MATSNTMVVTNRDYAGPANELTKEHIADLEEIFCRFQKNDALDFKALRKICKLFGMHLSDGGDDLVEMMCEVKPYDEDDDYDSEPEHDSIDLPQFKQFVLNILESEAKVFDLLWSGGIPEAFDLSRFKKIKGESTNFHEKSLIYSLRDFQSKFSNLTDFKIICRDQEQIQSHKLLLAARSKYFEALFRQEPETTSITLDYQVQVVTTLTKSLVTGNFGHIEFDECFALFRLADYLLMDDFINELEVILADNLNMENIDEIVDLADNFSKNPTLNYKWQKFIKENICLIDLTKISKGLLKSLTTSPPCYIKDVNGRFMDFMESEVKLVEALDNLDPNEDWNIPIMSKRRIYRACTSGNISEKMRKRSSDIVEKFSDRKKYLPMSHETILSGPEIVLIFEMDRGEYDISWPIGPFGTNNEEGTRGATGGRARRSTQKAKKSSEWSVEGPFHKISVKTRICNGLQIVQGLKFEFEDGTVEAYGMDINDESNVSELEVPKGQHIKDVILKSGKHIDQIGFTTNEGMILGPVGGDGGKLRHVPPRVYHRHNYFQLYLHDIKGITLIENDGKSFIAELEFRFISLENQTRVIWGKKRPEEAEDDMFIQKKDRPGDNPPDRYFSDSDSEDSLFGSAHRSLLELQAMGLLPPHMQHMI